MDLLDLDHLSEPSDYWDYINKLDKELEKRPDDPLILGMKLALLRALRQEDQVNQLLDEFEEVKITVNTFYFKLQQAVALHKMSKFNLSTVLFDQLLSFEQNHKYKLDLLIRYYFNYDVSSHLRQVGDTSGAIDRIKANIELLDVLEPSDMHRKLGLNYNRLGVMYDYLGDMLNSIRYYEQAASSFKLAEDPSNLLWVVYNLAGIYLRGGQLDHVEDYLDEAEQLAIQLDDQFGLGHIHIHRSNHLFALGRLDEALRVLSEAERILDDRGSWTDIFFVYTNYMDISLEIEDYESYNQYHDKLNSLLLQHPADLYYDTYRRIYSAIRKKISGTTRQRAEAMNELEDIASGPSIDQEITYMVITHYLEMLIEDFIESSDITTYEEIKNYIGKLEKFAFEQEISFLLAKAYLFKSKLALVEGNVDDANRLLNQSKDIARRFGYRLLEMSISADFDLIHELLQEDRKFLDKTSLSQRIKDARLQELVVREASLRPKIIKQEPLQPFKFMIIDYEARIVAYHDFVEDLPPEVIALETAVLTLAESQAMLDRLNRKDKIALIMEMQQFIAVLLFTGPSYRATSFLEEFEQELSAVVSLASKTEDHRIQDIVEKFVDKFRW